MGKNRKIRRVKQSRPSHFYSILSVALVLFLIGLVGLLIMNAQILSTYFKENLQINVVLNDKIAEAELLNLQQNLDRQAFVKSLQYISKNKAKTIFEEEFGEGIEEVLGFNPLFASLDIRLNAAYANADSLKMITPQIESNPIVKEVYYQKSLLQLVNRNLRIAGIILLIISVVFLIIAFTIIDNTIKLMMYSQRFIIKSMQLVGATRRFITKPFLSRSITNGLIAAVTAILLLTLLLLYFQYVFEDLVILKDLIRFSIVCAVILALGLFISWWSTRRSVLKYIKMKLDELY